MVIVELDPAVIVLGSNVAVAPEGSPLALSAIGWAEPLVTAEVIVVDALLPWATAMSLGLEFNEKSLRAVTVRLSDVVYVVEVPVPLRLMV